MPTTFEVDGLRAELEYDAEQEVFDGTCILPEGQGTLTFSGRSVEELKRCFRETRAAHESEFGPIAA